MTITLYQCATKYPQTYPLINILALTMFFIDVICELKKGSCVKFKVFANIAFSAYLVPGNARMAYLNNNLYLYVKLILI